MTPLTGPTPSGTLTTSTTPKPSGTLTPPTAPTPSPTSRGADDRDRQIGAALARIELLAVQLDAAAGDDTAAARARLARVLARPEFQLGKGPLERFLDWLIGLLPEPALIPAVEWLSRLVALALLATAMGAIGLLLVNWLRGILAGLVADAALVDPAAGADDLPRSVAAARRQATALAEVGNYREAVRRLFLAALLGLEERGQVRLDRSLTNREYLAQVRRDGPVSAHLAPVVATFEAVWYGVREPDAATFAQYEAEVAALEQTGAER